MNISGYVRNTLYFNCKSNSAYYGYSEKWINIFPEVAPSLHTLILHLYAAPQALFPVINRFSDTIRHLDVRILITSLVDICVCEKSCHLGRQLHLEMVQGLKNLTELKFHNRLEENEIENFPVTLKKLWLTNRYNNQSLVNRAFKRGIEILELPRFN